MHFLSWCSEEPTSTVSLDGRKCHNHWADLELHVQIPLLLIISAVIDHLVLALMSSSPAPSPFILFLRMKNTALHEAAALGSEGLQSAQVLLR